MQEHEVIEAELIEPEQAIVLCERPGMLARCDSSELTEIAHNLYAEAPDHLRDQQLRRGLLQMARGGQIDQLMAIARDIISHYELSEKSLALAPQQHIEIAPRLLHDYRQDFRETDNSSHTTINNYYVQGDFVGGDYNAQPDNYLPDYAGLYGSPVNAFSQPNINVTVSPEIHAYSRADAYSESYSNGDGKGWLLLPFAIIALIVGIAASGD